MVLLESAENLSLRYHNRQQLPTQIEVFTYLRDKYFPIIDKWIDIDYGFASNSLVSNDKHSTIKNILLCVEAGRESFDFINGSNIDLVISHHPSFVSVPHLHFHLPMDFAVRMSQNRYFAYRMGLKNVELIGDSYVVGYLPVPMTFPNLLRFLNKRGYNIKPVKRVNNNDLINSVCFVAGLGSYAFSDRLRSLGLPVLDNVRADIFITGQLFHNFLPNFDKVLEIGHTNSEKPIFRWVRHVLLNRWENLNVLLLPDELESWTG